MKLKFSGNLFILLFLTDVYATGIITKAKQLLNFYYYRAITYRYINI